MVSNLSNAEDIDDEPAEREETIAVPPDAAGTRLDTFLARRQDLHSRTFFQQLVKDGRVTVDGATAKPSVALEGGETVVVRFPPAESPWPHPQDLPIEILHADDDVIVVNKAAGMITHPAAGNPDGTLVNALLWHFPDLPGINGVKRPGIVHRLDRETSGVMVVAKNDRSMKILSKAIHDRRVSRQYCALAIGDPDWNEKTVDAPIGRHDTMRVKRAVNGHGAQNAVTHFRVLARMHGFSLLRCRLETGRTHQIRVHCGYSGMPIAGDEMYGGTEHRALEKLQNADARLRKTLRNQKRPFLHARSLCFTHPTLGTPVRYVAPLPADLMGVLRILAPEMDFEELLRREIDEQAKVAPGVEREA